MSLTVNYGAGFGVHGVGHAEVNRIHVDLLGQLVEQALEGEAGLQHAVDAHGAERRPVGVHPPLRVSVVGDVVQGRDTKPA